MFMFNVYICYTCFFVGVLCEVENQDAQNPLSQRPSTQTLMLAIQ